MKKRMKTLAMVLLLGVTMVFGSITAYADEDPIVAEINEENFPDAAFREYVQTGYHVIWDENNVPQIVVYDANQDGKLSQSETADVQQILAAQMQIGDITGLSYFTSIIELQCQYNLIQTLDLSKNTELLYLNCYHNQLTGELDLTANTKLEAIATQNNPGITAINVTNCAELYSLNCENTGITSLDLNNNPKLQSLSCAASPLAALDVSNNPELAFLSCYGTNLTSLDLSKNTKLEDVDISGAPLAWLNIGENEILAIATELEFATTLTVSEGSFDITEVLPGIDASKVTIVSGATLNGTTVSGYDFATPIVYTYDCGTASAGDVTLTVTATLEKAVVDNSGDTNNQNATTDSGKTESPKTDDLSVMGANEEIAIMMAVVFAVAIGVVSLRKKMTA